jgi:hypothetical protein
MGVFMDWKIALKVGGPSVIATWAFVSMISLILEKSAIFKSSLLLNLIVIAVVFLFCISMGVLWIRASNRKKGGVLSGNKIVDNEVGENLNVAVGSTEIKNNEVRGNKVKKDMNIGGM